MKLYMQQNNAHELYFKDGSILFSYTSQVACLYKGQAYIHANFINTSTNTKKHINAFLGKTAERIQLTNEQFEAKVLQIIANG